MVVARKRHEEFEAAVSEAVSEILGERASELEKFGLRCVMKPPRQTPGPPYSSEIVIDIWDSVGIVDVIEFHVIEDDHPIAPLQEIERWLREAVEDSVRRRESRLEQ